MKNKISTSKYLCKLFISIYRELCYYNSIYDIRALTYLYFELLFFHLVEKLNTAGHAPKRVDVIKKF